MTRGSGRRRLDELTGTNQARKRGNEYFLFSEFHHIASHTKARRDNGRFGRIKSRSLWQIAISMFGCCRSTFQYISIS